MNKIINEIIIWKLLINRSVTSILVNLTANQPASSPPVDLVLPFDRVTSIPVKVYQKAQDVSDLFNSRPNYSS